MADRAIVEVRTISHLLHPPLLEEIGLASAVQAYAEEFARRSSIQATVDVPEDLERFPKEIELALFRTVQEGLTNVHRHSGAKSVEITLEPSDGEVCVLIKDDGRGVQPAVLAKFYAGVGGGVGLTGMRERIAELGGRLEVESSPRGTLLRARLPKQNSAGGGDGVGISWNSMNCVQRYTIQAVMDPTSNYRYAIRTSLKREARFHGEPYSYLLVRENRSERLQVY
jgi:signal transduction histidine kinase